VTPNRSSARAVHECPTLNVRRADDLLIDQEVSPAGTRRLVLVAVADPTGDRVCCGGQPGSSGYRFRRQRRQSPS